MCDGIFKAMWMKEAMDLYFLYFFHFVPNDSDLQDKITYSPIGSVSFN
jgi:hypothetical protein